MMKPACRLLWLVVLLLPYLAPTRVAAQTPQAPAPEFEKVEGGTVYFKGQKPLNTSLKEAKFLGFLASEEGAPYIVLNARNCTDCLEDRAIFLVRQDGGKTYQFVQPGKIQDPKTQTTLLESRAFFGRCLPGGKDAYIVFQKELIEKKKRGKRHKSIETSVFVAEPTLVGLQEKLSELRSVGSLQSKQSQTLALVKKKQCFEIEPRSRLMLSKPLDLKARRDGDDAEDEDEKEEKALEKAADAPSSESSDSARLD